MSVSFDSCYCETGFTLTTLSVCASVTENKKPKHDILANRPLYWPLQAAMAITCQAGCHKSEFIVYYEICGALNVKGFEKTI